MLAFCSSTETINKGEGVVRMDMKNPIGVGLLLFAKNGWNEPKFFAIKELKSKPQYHKYAGMKSFPLETYEEEDISFDVTINRIITEEVGVLPEEVTLLGIDQRNFRLIPERPDIITIYGYGIFHGDPHRKFHPTDDDIEFHGWENVRGILKKKIRIEVSPILKHFNEKNFKKVLEQF